MKTFTFKGMWVELYYPSKDFRFVSFLPNIILGKDTEDELENFILVTFLCFGFCAKW